MKKLCIAVLVLTAAASSFGQRTKTVTNQDLEKFRQKRVEAENKLKERYAELGFPSPEELEKQYAERRAEMEEYSDMLRERRIESQNDLVAEAKELRAEIAALDAQINYLRANRGGSPYKGGTIANQPFVDFYGYGGYGIYGGEGASGGFRGARRNRSSLRQIGRLPQNMRTVQEYGAMYPSSQSIYQQATGNVRIGGRFNYGGYGYGKRGYYNGGYVAPAIVGDGYYAAGDAGAEISYLEQQRAGLLARWRLLEEEARRAGIRLN
jgi:hypothetical protein